MSFNPEATEADKVTVLGYTFRSGGHLVWFFTSMLMLTYVAYARLRYPAVTQMQSWFILFHAMSSLQAVISTRFGRYNGRMYSVDCIWFNALMAVVLGVIVYVGR